VSYELLRKSVPDLHQKVSREKAVSDAEGFANVNGLSEHAQLFGRAALVARDPNQFDLIPELTEEERYALQYERDHKWHGSKMLWYSISLCAVGAATQGELFLERNSDQL
jgi:hypothetical protein